MTPQPRMTPNGESELKLNPPLSWKEARSRLRSFLEEYIDIDTAPTPVKKRDTDQTETKTTFISEWLKRDLDIYIGALGASIALLIIACLTFANGGLGSSPQTVDSRFRRSQLAAAILVVTGCIFNIWMLHRHRLSTSRGSDSLKRREISRFLREVEKHEEECLENPAGDSAIQESDLNLAGTSLTGVYPVYRQNYRSDGEVSGGSWSRIPTLLLVRGDNIALQIGDMAPAVCRAIEGPASAVSIESGERITLDTFSDTSISATGKLPQARTTLPKDSDDLLAVCNNMRIFVLLESPLEEFLRLPRGTFLFYPKEALTRNQLTCLTLHP